MTATVRNRKIREVENKLHGVSGLVNKTVYDAKSDIEKKYYATSDYKKFTSEILDAAIK